MKRTLLLFFALLGLSSLGAQTAVKGIDWESPVLLGQGNSAAGISGGWDALFTNPALFASKKGEVTALSVGGGGVIDPYALYADMKKDGKKILPSILEQVTDHGLGGRAQIGLGWVGRGWGVGLAVTANTDVPKAETVAGATVNIDTNTALIFGYSHRFELGDNLHLDVGGDLRTQVKVFLRDVNLQDILGAVNSQYPSAYIVQTFDDVLFGWGIGGDVGVAVKWGMLRGSLAFRDIGHTRYFTTKTTLAQLVQFKLGSKVSERYMVPMTMRFGLAFDPGWELVNPKVHAEYIQPLASKALLATSSYGNWLTRLNIGTEVSISKVIDLRAGLRGGYLTAGFGLDFLLFELNAAVWGQESGFYLGESPQVAGAVEIAFRY